MTRSFRSTKEDDRHIAQICLDRGGISPTDAIRVALAECASQSPVLAVKPTMASPPDLKEFLRALEKYGDDLVYVAETGLPLDQPNASDADRKELSAARGKFRAIHARTEAMQLELEQFQRMIAALSVSDVLKLQAAAKHLRRAHQNRLHWIEAGKLDPKVARNAELWIHECSGPLLEWFVACGLLPP